MLSGDDRIWSPQILGEFPMQPMSISKSHKFRCHVLASPFCCYNALQFIIGDYTYHSSLSKKTRTSGCKVARLLLIVWFFRIIQRKVPLRPRVLASFSRSAMEADSDLNLLFILRTYFISAARPMLLRPWLLSFHPSGAQPSVLHSSVPRTSKPVP